MNNEVDEGPREWPRRGNSVGTVGLLSFLVELTLLAVLVVAGYGLTGPTAVRIVLAIAFPLVALVIWARWCAPKSPRQLGDPHRFTLQCGIFVLAGVALSAAGEGLWGGAFAGVAIVVFALSRHLD